ncbi:MAG: SDR family NAD(P)-dependent oxidoreductase [Burkholderiaceae bacterium]
MMPLLPALNPRITDWRDKRVWIVGASSGIGAELARQLHAQGARVALSARRRTTLEAVIDQNASSAPALILPMDAANPNDWREGMDTLSARWGGVDMVVFAAATYHPCRPWELTAADVRRTLEINLASVYYGLEVVVPPLLAQGSGAIALIGSVAGYMGLPKATLYGPTKAALINLAELLYAELRHRGVGVYLINPGFVQTRLTAANDFYMPGLLTTQEAARYIVKGFSKGQFEIHFPKRFSIALKLAGLAPYRARLAMLKNLAKNT